MRHIPAKHLLFAAGVVSSCAILLATFLIVTRVKQPKNFQGVRDRLMSAEKIVVHVHDFGEECEFEIVDPATIRQLGMAFEFEAEPRRPDPAPTYFHTKFFTFVGIYAAGKPVTGFTIIGS